ncbi:MAG: BtrH N-terminal domain-containing protein, partial [Chloroflexota bacterium]|nr:BtrH N-terminal domain-containing protein [Chloroflexota bacterium]
MPTLQSYNQFDGVHPEMGTIRNVLAHQGVVAPHTGEPFTEAMLLGISGGISVLYFSFDYEGHEPHVYIGTHLASPTDKPVEAVLERLGIKGHIRETTSRDRARANLIEALQEGWPVIAWAGQRGLPYNALSASLDPGMMPLVVYGYEPDHDTVYIADRARVPLTVHTEEFEMARAAQGNLKNRSLTLEAPSRLKNLSGAVEAGIRRCAKV